MSGRKMETSEKEGNRGGGKKKKDKMELNRRYPDVKSLTQCPLICIVSFFSSVSKDRYKNIQVISKAANK